MSEVRDESRHGADRGLASKTISRGLRFSRCRRLRSAVDWRYARCLRFARCEESAALRIAGEPLDSPELHRMEVAGKTDWSMDGNPGDGRYLLPPRVGRTKTAATGRTAGCHRTSPSG